MHFHFWYVLTVVTGLLAWKNYRVSSSVLEMICGNGCCGYFRDITLFLKTSRFLTVLLVCGAIALVNLTPLSKRPILLWSIADVVLLLAVVVSYEIHHYIRDALL